ncbi:MAG: oligosaccharide flippase family protein [Vicinamibacterales bacterium]
MSGAPAGTAPDDVNALAGDAERRQRRGTQQLLLARVLVYGSAYVVAAILARQLGAEDYGTYGVIMSQLLWLEIVVNSGVPAAMAKRLADDAPGAAAIEAAGRGLLVGGALAAVGLGWLGAPTLAGLMRIPSGDWLLRLALLDVPLAAAYASYEGLLYGTRRFGVLAVAQAGVAAARIAGVVVLTRLGVSLVGALLVNVLATAAVCTALALRFPPRRLTFPWSRAVALVTVAAPVALYLVTSQVVVNLDLWALKSLWRGDADVVGFYVASANLARTLGVVPAVQAGVLFASIAWAVAAGDRARATRHIQEAARFALVVVTAAVAILSLDAGEILSVLFSRAYAGGGAYFPFQVTGFALFALMDVFANALMAGGRRWMAAAVIVCVLPVMLAANVVLIPRFGAVGAGTSMVLSIALCTAATGALTYRAFGPVVRLATLARIAAAAAVAAAVSRLLPVAGPLVLVKTAALGLLYLGVLAALGEISRDDLGFGARSGAAS